MAESVLNGITGSLIQLVDRSLYEEFEERARAPPPGPATKSNSTSATLSGTAEQG